MPRLPALKAREIVRALGKLGFIERHRKGSHRFFQHQSDPTRTTVVPVHSGEDIGRGLLHSILRQAKISPHEFRRVLS